jgi:hypothetical protein
MAMDVPRMGRCVSPVSMVLTVPTFCITGRGRIAATAEKEDTTTRKGIKNTSILEIFQFKGIDITILLIIWHLFRIGV